MSEEDTLLLEVGYRELCSTQVDTKTFRIDNDVFAYENAVSMMLEEGAGGCIDPCSIDICFVREVTG